jgi:hypothetical protein
MNSLTDEQSKVSGLREGYQISTHKNTDETFYFRVPIS